jgi:hypothetical protein
VQETELLVSRYMQALACMTVVSVPVDVLSLVQLVVAALKKLL